MSSGLLIALNGLQSASAFAFSSFLVLHLAAPVTAVVSGERGANRMMAVGRELYQARYLEGIFVFGSIAIHTSSGLVKRFIRWQNGAPLASLDLHKQAGYAMIPLVLGHIYTHRLLPARLGHSPSLFSYSFVAYSFRTSPILSLFGYGGLVTVASYHVLAGMRSLVFGRRKHAALTQIEWKTAYAGLVAMLTIGIARMAAQPHHIPAYLAKAYNQVLGIP